MRRLWLILIATLLCALSACPGEASDKPGYWKKALDKAKSHSEKSIILGNLRKQKPQDEDFLPLLHKILADEKSSDVKVAAVRIIADMRHPTSLAPLQNALNLNASGAHARDLNRAIAEALVALKSPETEPVFLGMLKSKDPFTLFPAVEGLGQLRSKQAVPFLLEMLENPATPLNEQPKYIAALGHIADPSAIPVLEKKLITRYLEHDAALALFRIGKPAADALLAILQDKNTALSRWASSQKISSETLLGNATSVLGDMQDARAENLLIAKLNSAAGKYALKEQAVNALGRMRSAKATNTLTRLALSEPDFRGLAVIALAQIGNPNALPELKKAASTGNFNARLRALAGVALLGGEAELAFFNKQMDNERALFAKDLPRLKEECAARPPCDEEKEIKRIGEGRVAELNQLKDALETSSKCAEKESCWAETLEDSNANSLIRQRAAYFLGRSKNPQQVEVLGKQLADADLDVRMSALLAISWLVKDEPLAAQQAKQLIAPMQQQMDEERGRSQHVGVRDEMWRVLWTLQNLP